MQTSEAIAMRPIPRAWRASDIRVEDVLRTFGPDAQDEVLAWLAAAPAHREIEELVVSRAMLPDFRAEVESELETLDHGAGFVVFEPIRGLDREQHRIVSWLISNALGDPEPQDPQGRQRYLVFDRGGERTLQQGARYHQTRQGGDFHTDNMQLRTDPVYLGLSCVASAMLGGETILVSGLTVHEMLQELPIDLETLERPFLWEQRGVSGVYEAPLISYDAAGEPHFRYQRAYIEAAHAKAGHPLTARQVSALNTLDAIFELSAVQFRCTLTPGQMAVVNDTQIFHARTPFIDFNRATEVYDFALEPGNRLMERTWITRHRA